MPADILDPNSKIEPVLDPTHPDITKYLDGLFFQKEDSLLEEMHTLAKERNFPIVGPHVGLMLKFLALSINATKIFELGSGFGYSAYWFFQAMGKTGEIYCTDGSQENADIAKDFLGRAHFWDQVTFGVGWAQDELRESDGLFDIIYNDVDKDAYPEIWELAKDRVRPGGYYIADNTLWHGRVTLEKVKTDVKPGWTAAIKEHNKMIAGDPNFDSFLNPIRDGVLVARKKDS